MSLAVSDSDRLGQAVSSQCSTGDYSTLSSTLTNLDGASANRQSSQDHSNQKFWLERTR